MSESLPHPLEHSELIQHLKAESEAILSSSTCNKINISMITIATGRLPMIASMPPSVGTGSTAANEERVIDYSIESPYTTLK